MSIATEVVKLPVIAVNLLNDIETRLQVSTIDVSTNKLLSDEDLLSLYSVFGAVLQRALDILERYSNLTIYTTKNCRELIEIKGDSDRCYRVFPRINFCPCLAYRHQVIERKSQISCKHVLAARLAQILGRTSKHDITVEQYLMLLKSMFDLDSKT